MRLQVIVLIPADVKELHEANTAFRHTSRKQTVISIAALLMHIRTIEVEHTPGLRGHVSELGHRSLHAIGELVLRNARQNFWILYTIVLELIQLAERIEQLTSPHAVASRGVREIEYGIALGPKAHSLV